MNDSEEDMPTVETIYAQIVHGKTYFLVLLYRGPADRSNEKELEALQKQHLQYLFRLRLQKKLLLNGPTLDDVELRDICIFQSKDVEEVRLFIEADPLVASGYLTYEMHPWMGMPGDTLT